MPQRPDDRIPKAWTQDAILALVTPTIKRLIQRAGIGDLGGDPIDHGSLGGLADDDHTQYLPDLSGTGGDGIDVTGRVVSVDAGATSDSGLGFTSGELRMKDFDLLPSHGGGPILPAAGYVAFWDTDTDTLLKRVLTQIPFTDVFAVKGSPSGPNDQLILWDPTAEIHNKNSIANIVNATLHTDDEAIIVASDNGISLDINNMTRLVAPASNDDIAVYDTTAAAHRKASFEDIINNVLFVGRIRKPTDETKTTDTTLADDDSLVVGLNASKSYIVDMVVFVIAESAAPDLKFEITVPTAAELALCITMKRDSGGVNNVTFYDTSGTDESRNLAGSSVYILEIFGTVKTSMAGSGNIAFRWAQNTSHADDLTVKKGSYIRVMETG
jgi:hypothetical protein